LKPNLTLKVAYWVDWKPIIVDFLYDILKNLFGNARKLDPRGWGVIQAITLHQVS